MRGNSFGGAQGIHTAKAHGICLDNRVTTLRAHGAGLIGVSLPENGLPNRQRIPKRLFDVRTVHVVVLFHTFSVVFTASAMMLNEMPARTIWVIAVRFMVWCVTDLFKPASFATSVRPFFKLFTRLPL